MLPCQYDCKLRDLLQIKETKINKLKQVQNDLDNLCYHQPSRHREVESKMTIVNDRKITYWGQTINSPNRTRVRGM